MRWSSHQPSYPAYHIEDCWILHLLANLTFTSKFDRKIHPKLVDSLSYMFKEIFILLLNSIRIKICTGTKLSSSIYVTESKNHSWQLSFIVSAQLKVDNGKKLGIYCVIIIQMGGGHSAPISPPTSCNKSDKLSTITNRFWKIEWNETSHNLHNFNTYSIWPIFRW